MSAKHLVIVESPAKARSISKYLGSEYMVKATIGHVIDLPPKELGVDVENGFEPKNPRFAENGEGCEVDNTWCFSLLMSSCFFLANFPHSRKISPFFSFDSK